VQPRGERAERFALQPQPVALNGFEVLAARDGDHFMSRAREHGGERAAEPSDSNDRNPHGALMHGEPRGSFPQTLTV
jgi:hypothetical protein